MNIFDRAWADTQAIEDQKCVDALGFDGPLDAPRPDYWPEDEWQQMLDHYSKHVVEQTLNE